ISLCIENPLLKKDLFHHRTKLNRSKWFCKVVLSPLFHSLHRCPNGGIGSNHDSIQTIRCCHIQNLHAIFTWHSYIEKEKIEGFLFYHLDGLDSILYR